MLTEALAALALSTPVIVGECPGHERLAGCYFPPPVNVAYVRRDGDRYTTAHELGHAADHLRLSDGERRRISCHPAMQRPGVSSPCGRAWVHLKERYADAFAACYIDLPTESVLIGSGRGYEPKNARRHRNFCRLISRATAS